MKTIIGNLKTNLIEKEGILDEYETLIKRLRREQDELHSELDEQKTKNNVRRHSFPSHFSVISWCDHFQLFKKKCK